MSAVPRGPRGGRGPRNRGGGRGGTNAARTKPLDGNESDAGSAARRTTSRGRGRGTSSQNSRGGIAQAFQQATRQQNSSRGTKTPRGGSRAATPSTNGFATHNKNETPEERWSRLKVRREAEREDAVKKGLMSGNLPLSLDHAITLVGTCQDMCAEFERARRIYQKDVWGPEMVRQALSYVFRDQMAIALGRLIPSRTQSSRMAKRSAKSMRRRWSKSFSGLLPALMSNYLQICGLRLSCSRLVIIFSTNF